MKKILPLLIVLGLSGCAIRTGKMCQRNYGLGLPFVFVGVKDEVPCPEVLADSCANKCIEIMKRYNCK